MKDFTVIFFAYLIFWFSGIAIGILVSDARQHQHPSPITQPCEPAADGQRPTQ